MIKVFTRMLSPFMKHECLLSWMILAPIFASPYLVQSNSVPINSIISIVMFKATTFAAFGIYFMEEFKDFYAKMKAQKLKFKEERMLREELEKRAWHKANLRLRDAKLRPDFSIKMRDEIQAELDKEVEEIWRRK